MVLAVVDNLSGDAGRTLIYIRQIMVRTLQVAVFAALHKGIRPCSESPFLHLAKEFLHLCHCPANESCVSQPTVCQPCHATALLDHAAGHILDHVFDQSRHGSNLPGTESSTCEPYVDSLPGHPRSASGSTSKISPWDDLSFSFSPSAISSTLATKAAASAPTGSQSLL